MAELNVLYFILQNYILFLVTYLFQERKLYSCNNHDCVLYNYLKL